MMKNRLWPAWVVASLIALVLTGCGGADKREVASVGGVDAQTTSKEASSVSEAERIEAAFTAGDIDAETALARKVFALFGHARHPASALAASGDEFDSDALVDVESHFHSLSPSAQRTLMPYFLRPSVPGSWATPSAPVSVGRGRVSADDDRDAACKGSAAGWMSTGLAGSSKVRIWYDSAHAADRPLATSLSSTIEKAIWPKLVNRFGHMAPQRDASSAACEGVESRLDVYLVHGLKARGVTVPEKAPNAGPLRAFTLLNADSSSEVHVSAARLIADAFEYLEQANNNRPAASQRMRTLALPNAGRPQAAAAALADAATPGAPIIVQTKTASLAAPVVTVALDVPVVAGNWIAVGISTIGTAPRNVTLADSQGNVDLNFAASASRYTNPFGTIWRYVKSNSSGLYSLNVSRAAATSGAVHVLEIGNGDPTTFLDIASSTGSGNSLEASSTFAATTTRTNDVLLSLVGVRSNAVTLAPAAPAGATLNTTLNNGVTTSGVMSFGTTTAAAYRLAASLSAARTWRMSSLAVRGVAAPAPVLAPVNTALPAIAVTDNASFLGLAASQGSWSNNPTSFTYAWTRNGTLIPGATLATYNTVAADQGTSVAAVITASNSAGAASATSAAVPVPVPGPPSAPVIAFTASPSSITQGQTSTLAWSTVNATSCSASGAWSGAQALSGSAGVSPAANASYALDCVGAAGSTSASVTVQVSAAPPASNPTLGAHALVYHRTQGSTGPTLSVPAMTTQAGSTLLAVVGKGSLWNLSLPFDNKGNSPYAQLGPVHERTRWPGQGTALYGFGSIAGGAGHVVSINDSNVWDEVTFAVVEVRNGGVIQDYKFNEVPISATHTTLSVTTTGAATLVAAWIGDDASATPSNPVPNNGFTVIDGIGTAIETVQMFVATKDVAAAGTYNLTWSTTPTQGAQLYLVAIQKR